MLKKTFAAVALAGALILGTATAASALTYPDQLNVTISSPTVTVGNSTVITVTGLDGLDVVTFSHDAGAGASIASIAFTAIAGSSVDKPVAAGTASATFTATTPGSYTISIYDGSTLLGSVPVTVAAAGSGADSDADGLADSGGTVPAAVIWVGVGAIGLGGIALAAVAARRRTQKV